MPARTRHTEPRPADSADAVDAVDSADAADSAAAAHAGDSAGPGVAGTRPQRYLVTCEHGGRRIPAAYRHLFADHRPLLATHRGYDPGALAMARELARALDAPLVASITSRLLVDLNRSVGHPRLHSETVARAGAPVRREIVRRHYLPYRQAVQDRVAQALAEGGRLVHLSSHSFTPVLDGEVRNADLGLLYDPARPGEVELCERWLAGLRAHAPQLRVRRNYPYVGKGDGLTTALRRQHAPDRYVGVELEVNQKHVLGAARGWPALRRAIAAALVEALPQRPGHAGFGAAASAERLAAPGAAAGA